MGDKYKFKALEKNGVDITFGEEVELSAANTDFDPTGLLNFEATDDDVQKALARVGNFSIADIAEIEGFNSNATETTTSNGWVSKSGFPWQSQNKTAGEFSIRWFFQVGQTKATRNFGYRVLVRLNGGPWTEVAAISFASVGRDNGRVMQSGFKEITLPADGTIEVDVQHGQTISGFASIMENVSIEVRRLGDL